MINNINKEYSLLYKNLEKSLIKFDVSKLPFRKKLYLLKLDIKEAIKTAYDNIEEELQETLEEIASDHFLETLFLSEINSKINISQHTVDKVDNIVENIVNRIVAGKTLQQRLRRNREFIINQSRLIIEKMINNSIPQMAREIKRILKIDRNKALTIAITEAHRIKEESTNKGYEEAKKNNIKFDKEWIATLDSKVRDKHRTLDGQLADQDGYFWSGEHKTKFPGGFNVASLDIRCRCSMRQIFKQLKGTDIRYVQETGEYIEYKTYREWAAAHNVA